MAQLDVSDILTDSEFMDRFTVVRNLQTINDKGRAVNTEDQTPARGVITANNGMQLNRQPDGSLVNGAITIHTRYRLTSGVDGRDADEVIWQGVRYIVDNVADYSHYGHGFVAASCTIKPVTG